MACLCIFVITLLQASLLLPETAANPLSTERSLVSSSRSRCPPVPSLPASTLKVLVPNRSDFKEFVDCSDPHSVTGFSVAVFKSAMSTLMPRNVSYFCFDLNPEGESDEPTYNDLVNCLSDGVFDAVVGDVTIASNRLENASFTQPYADSGIVLLAPMVGQPNRFPGVFFAPFSGQMWGTIITTAVATGIVLWLLEQSKHPPQHLLETLWFSVSLLIFFKRETVKNPLSKAVLIGWMTFIVVLGSVYTAALSAILTVHKLAPDNLNISTVKVHSTWGVGYQKGSIVLDYINKTLQIPEERLVMVNSIGEFAEALLKGPYIKNNGVAVIVEEVPYVNVFLSSLPAANCDYAIVPPKLTSEGLGFAFRKGSSSLSTEFSMAILDLSESGELRRLQTGAQINDYQCSPQVQSSRLNLSSSQGLFLLLALLLLFCALLFFAKLTPHCLHRFC